MLGFLGGAAKGAQGELEDQDKRAFALKLQNAQIEGQLESAKKLADYNSASEVATSDMSDGKESGRANAKTQEWWMQKQANKTKLSMPFGGRGGAVISGKMIMDNIPKGEELGLDPNKQYPMATANFLRAATKDNMGTAEMRNRVVGIDEFQGSLESLRTKYRKFDPSNPAAKTVQQMWSGMLKGYSFTGRKTAEEAGLELKEEVTRSAENYEVADMLLAKIQLGIDLTKATAGSRASDLDLKTNMSLIPDYTQDVNLQDLRFKSLSERSDRSMSAITKVAPKLAPPPPPAPAPHEVRARGYDSMTTAEKAKLLVEKLAAAAKAKEEADKAAAKGN